jgi:hypothetical protein
MERTVCYTGNHVVRPGKSYRLAQDASSVIEVFVHIMLSANTLWKTWNPAKHDFNGAFGMLIGLSTVRDRVLKGTDDSCGLERILKEFRALEAL